MPIYEYDCLECDHSFDKLVRKPSEVDQISCPTCGGGEVKKKLSLFSSQGFSSLNSSSAASCASGGV
jgi:putative FmdB family regulatory protein